MLGEDQNIDWTVAMADPFAILCDHMRKLDLNPEVMVEPYPKSPTNLRVVSLSVKDSDEDWISSMFANTELLQDLMATCDIALQNQGKLLVIEPKTFYITRTTRYPPCLHNSAHYAAWPWIVIGIYLVLFPARKP